MKNILIATIMGLFTLTACAKEEPKAAPAVEVKAPAETKQVCLDVKDKNGKPVIDSKTGKTKQNCKTVKKHKKHEGTKIEDAKKKK